MHDLSSAIPKNKCLASINSDARYHLRVVVKCKSSDRNGDAEPSTAVLPPICQKRHHAMPRG